MSKKKARIKELETELRILYSDLWSRDKRGKFHARHNKKFAKYAVIIDELESISLKWKINKIIRRIKLLWQK